MQPPEQPAARRYVCPNCRIVLRVVVSGREVRCERCGHAKIETGGVLPNGYAGVILKHAADTR